MVLQQQRLQQQPLLFEESTEANTPTSLGGAFRRWSILSLPSSRNRKTAPRPVMPVFTMALV